MNQLVAARPQPKPRGAYKSHSTITTRWMDNDVRSSSGASMRQAATTAELPLPLDQFGESSLLGNRCTRLGALPKVATCLT